IGRRMQPTRTNSDTSKDLWGDLMEISVGMEYRNWTDWIAVMPRNQRDNDLAKGALEQEDSLQHGNNSLRGQLGHRNQDDMIKESDSDFPEPGSNPEHSGGRETEADSERMRQTQESGERQKKNQGQSRRPAGILNSWDLASYA